MRLGHDETVVCLQDTGDGHCVAHKYTTFWLGAPAWVSDDGYVIADKSGAGHRPLDATEAARTLPPYSFGLVDYAFGLSFWWILFLLFLTAVAIHRNLRRRELAERQIPISETPPVVATAGDRYLVSQVEPLLTGGEQITHLGYGEDRDRPGFVSSRNVRGFLAALTTRRLVLIATPVDALDNRGVESIDRAAIRAVHRVRDRVAFHLRDGTVRTLVMRRRRQEFSNQDAFLRDVPRLLQ